MSNNLILSAQYLPPISYFHIIQQNPEKEIFIDQFEHFQKQSYRTRARIASANGIQDLILPIMHGRKERVAMKDVKISYEFDWQRLHWLSLQTAYRSSPYFEFYEDDFARFYSEKPAYLLDFNVSQLTLLLKVLKLKKDVQLTSSYNNGLEEVVPDFRDLIHPKRESLLVHAKPYYQVFSDKNGFFADLSIVDLLFNQGPQAKMYL